MHQHPELAEMARPIASLKHIRPRFPGDRARIRACTAEFGEQFVVMAGPCAVECERQIMETAAAVARSGASVLRGGAFKPRTSPYAFQGLGLHGLQLLRKAADEFNLAVVTEAMCDTQVPLVAEYADIIQIGARSMENLSLLAAVARAGRPILLKRGLTATIEELLESAEFVAARGNPNIILCERGIRTYGTITRNTCDIAAIPVLNLLTRLPVVLDPSHATGRRTLIAPIARAGVAIGADGLLVEVHPSPATALSDGSQSLDFSEFDDMIRTLDPWIALWRESRTMTVAASAD